jgi:hypothetical protein
MANATMVVPPMYEVTLFGQGFCAAQISARKVKLVSEATLKFGAERSYKQSDNVAQMTFAQLVQFVIGGPK